MRGSAIGAELRVDQNLIPELQKRVPAAMRQVVRDMTEKAAQLARAFCPVDTGALQASIDTEYSGNQYFAQGVVVVGEDYGIYVEYGTRYQQAQPFLTPALDIVATEFDRRVETAIEQIIADSSTTIL